MEGVGNSKGGQFIPLVTSTPPPSKTIRRGRKRIRSSKPDNTSRVITDFFPKRLRRMEGTQEQPQWYEDDLEWWDDCTQRYVESSQGAGEDVGGSQVGSEDVGSTEVRTTSAELELVEDYRVGGGPGGLTEVVCQDDLLGGGVATGVGEEGAMDDLWGTREEHEEFGDDTIHLVESSYSFKEDEGEDGWWGNKEEHEDWGETTLPMISEPVCEGGSRPDGKEGGVALVTEVEAGLGDDTSYGGGGMVTPDTHGPVDSWTYPGLQVTEMNKGNTDLPSGESSETDEGNEDDILMLMNVFEGARVDEDVDALGPSTGVPTTTIQLPTAQLEALELGSTGTGRLGGGYPSY